MERTEEGDRKLQSTRIQKQTAAEMTFKQNLDPARLIRFLWANMEKKMLLCYSGADQV